MLSPPGDHILQEFNTLYLTRFRTYKNCQAKPKQIPRRGGVPRQINTCRKVPLQINFFLLTTFCFGVYIVNQSMAKMKRWHSSIESSQCTEIQMTLGCSYDQRSENCMPQAYHRSTCHSPLANQIISISHRINNFQNPSNKNFNQVYFLCCQSTISWTIFYKQKSSEDGVKMELADRSD